MMNYLSCCCFARRAGYRNYFEAGLPAVLACKLAEGFYGIGDFEYGFTGKFFIFDVFAYHGTSSAFCEGTSYVVVAIEIFADNRKETITGFGRA